MDMKTVDEERAEIAKAMMGLSRHEVEALKADEMFGELAFDEIKRRDELRDNLSTYSTPALAAMRDNPEAVAVVDELLEGRRDYRLRREGMAERGVAVIG